VTFIYNYTCYPAPFPRYSCDIKNRSFTARPHAQYWIYSNSICPSVGLSVCPEHFGVVSK